MTDIALIFPGQGAQKVGMGREFYENSAQARAVFDQAEGIVGARRRKNLGRRLTPSLSELGFLFFSRSDRII